MVITRFGGPEVFEEREVPLPQPQAHEILVKVHATSVNPMDCSMRRGPWPDLTPPAILGYDVSGEVAAVGEGVLDTAGKETLSRSTAITKPFGRLVTIVGQTGDVTRGVYKNLTIYLVLIQRARSKLDELRALIEQGRLKPVVDTVLPLHEVAQAHQRLEQGGMRGKIVLQVGTN